MFLSPWIQRFRQRLNGSRRSRCIRKAQQLEQRTLLTLNGVLVGTDLSLFVDEGDDITVQNDTATGNVSVTVNGTPASTVPAVQSSTLTSLNIIAGDDDNTIDVSAVTAADFNALTAGAIEVHGDDGADVITASPIGGLYVGDHGDDVLNGGAGDDTIDGDDGQIGRAHV